MWRDWFTFSKQDRRAIFLLSVLIVIVLLLLCTKPVWWHEKPYEAYTPDSLLQSLGDAPSEKLQVQIFLHSFNPNTADSLELLSVGLPSHVVRNILRYRKAGGVFRKSEDLARIYGMHDTIFTRVKPYIMIPADEYLKSKL